ncbi:LacI family DNA-binding transcriptional regulator [Parafrigoribacterium mesophilum]|uniref:LacI family DNA-binding transcriptional regulator n=1 Tax=Parafrigoribacterium mesophilum TaxID=433646 RepID=UPI0031FCDC08
MVTVRDLARMTGVSTSTVSRALTHPDKVAPAKREHIQRVAAELGYQPNLAARGLITGKTGNIGLVVPDIENPVFAAVVKGAQSRARRNDYAVFIADTEEDARLESEFVSYLAQQVDGLVLFSSRMSDEALHQHASRIPIVLVNRESEGMHALTVDNVDGMRQALMHLHALGHTCVAYVSGPRDSWSDKARTRGLRGAEAELPGIEILEMGHFAPVFAGGVAAADRAIASGATAVVCFNDLIALGVLSRMTSRGIAVPGDVSIIGFDDIPAATLVSPALTTLAVPHRQLGKEAIDMLITEIIEPSVPKATRTLSVDLIVRGSSGAIDRR